MIGVLFHFLHMRRVPATPIQINESCMESFLIYVSATVNTKRVGVISASVQRA